MSGRLPSAPMSSISFCRQRKIIGRHSTGPEIARDAARLSYLEAQASRSLGRTTAEVSETLDSVLDTLLGFIEVQLSFPARVPAAGPHLHLSAVRDRERGESAGAPLWVSPAGLM